MSADLTLAEIVAEGLRLEREATEAYADSMFKTAEKCRDMLSDLYENHGARLVAACRAAMEMRRHVDIKEAMDDGGPVAFFDSGFEDAVLAFDAAANDAGETR